MISRNLFTDVLLIAMLVTLQIFLFNRIDIAGKYTACHLHIIFVLFYPFYRNLYIFLSASFIFRIIYRRIFRNLGYQCICHYTLSPILEPLFSKLPQKSLRMYFLSIIFSGHSFYLYFFKYFCASTISSEYRIF